MKFGKALVVLTGVQLEGGGGRSPLPFFKNWEKLPLIVEKIPNCDHLWVKFSFKMQFLEFPGEKTGYFFHAGTFFLVL